MTKFILVRHGEPTYKELEELGFKGYGFELAPLTQKGIEEIELLSKNPALENSDLIISSPFTRALQTASILGQNLNLKINVEILLYEWLVDLTNTYSQQSTVLKNMLIAKKEFEEYKQGQRITFNPNIETFLNVRSRALLTLSKYTQYEKVIVTTHGALISTLFEEKVKLHTGEYIEITDEELEKKYQLKTKKHTLTTY